MAKLTFKYTDTDEFEPREASKIELTVPDDMDIFEFKVVCMRLASSIGYHSESIKKAFGDDDINGTSDGLKDLLDEIGNKKTS